MVPGEGYGVGSRIESLKKATFVTEFASNFTSGEIRSAQRVVVWRLLGNGQWIWNGQTLSLTDHWTGMCKGFSGGIWDLYLIEAVVR